MSQMRLVCLFDDIPPEIVSFFIPTHHYSANHAELYGFNRIRSHDNLFEAFLSMCRRTCAPITLSEADFIPF